jgi:hypothetical protein
MMPVMGKLTSSPPRCRMPGQLSLTATAGSDSCPAPGVFPHGAQLAHQPHPAGSAAVIAKPHARPTIVKEQS